MPGGGWSRGRTGVSHRVQVGFPRSRPAPTPHRISLRLAARLLRLPLNIGGVIGPGSAGVPPASCPFGRRWASVRCCRQPSCRREQHRPGRRRAMAPFPVDPSGGDGRGCARLGAGGTPALPGSRHPMTSSHQGHNIAEAFWRRLWLKEVHLSSGLFVFIRVHWWFVFINDGPFFLE